MNEPTGAATPQVLADLYDRLYRAIRAVDNNHVIVMEGIWDWETLPNPADYNWQNVMYQFHYYCPMIAEPQKAGDPVAVMGQSCAAYGSMATQLDYQKAFIDAKLRNSLQNLYQVPVMVGEFSAHDNKLAWDYYVQTFNAQKWSWTVWSYKDRSSPSNWAVVNHANYDEDLPKFRAVEADGSLGDSYADLLRKLSKYATADYHVANWTLQEILKTNAIFPTYQTNKPEIFALSSQEITSPATFVITGRNFGASQGSSTVKINGLDLTPIHWADHQIEVNFPTGQSLGRKGVVVTTSQGSSSAADMIVGAPKATRGFAGIQPANDGSFTISGYGMCDTPGTVEFLPAVCLASPLESAICNKGDAAITFWSENLIKGYVPPDYALGSFGGAKVHCAYGGELYPTMISDNQSPVLNPIANRVVNEGALLSFETSVSDPDGNALTYSAVGLPSGAVFVNQNFSWTPSYSQSGKYNVIFRVSDGLADVEQAVLITVVDVPLPDLMVSAFSGPSAGFTGGRISVRNTIKNLGKVASGSPVTVGIYLSEDDVITAADMRIYWRTTTSLSAGSWNTLLSTVTIPSTLKPGRYYLGAIVDYNNVWLESDEHNNAVVGDPLVITPGVDLLVTAVNSVATAVGGTTIVVHDTVANQGSGSVSSFYVGLYLSKDQNITTSEIYLGRRKINSLAIGEINSAETGVTLPANLSGGTYYIGAIADYTKWRLEQNEMNNSLAGNRIAVTAN